MLQYWYVFPLAILLVGLCVAQVVLKYRREAESKEKEIADHERRTADTRVFCRLIPYQPLTAAEQLHTNFNLGAYRPLHREAIAIGNSEGLEIEARDQFGEKVTVTKIPWPDLTHFCTEELSVKKQLRDSFVAGIMMGLVASCVIVVIVLYKAGLGPLFQNPSRSVLVLLGLFLISPAIGLLFSFVPNLFRLKRDLLQFVLHKSDGTTFMLALVPAEQEKAKAVLGEFNLSRHDS